MNPRSWYFKLKNYDKSKRFGRAKSKAKTEEKIKYTSDSYLFLELITIYSHNFKKKTDLKHWFVLPRDVRLRMTELVYPKRLLFRWIRLVCTSKEAQWYPHKNLQIILSSGQSNSLFWGVFRTPWVIYDGTLIVLNIPVSSFSMFNSFMTKVVII